MRKPKNTESPIKAFMALSDAEKDAAVKKFDQPFVADTFRPLTPAMKAAWDRAKRKRGRPRVGAGVKVIAVSVEKSLLRRTDALAKKRGISRAALIARGLEAVLATAS